MKIAICLYGQPRDYKYGYNCINELIKSNSEHTYDFFFHCWIDDNVRYDCSPWRRIDEKTLYIGNQNDVKNEILELYKPLSYLYEKPLDKTSADVITEMEYIKNSKAYSNSSAAHRDNVFNIFSQIYSRGKVKDLFEEYIPSSKTQYDIVISTRFDGWSFPVNLKIPNVEKNKIYVSSMHLPRYIIPDNFLLMYPEIYVNFCNLYKNIKNIINNDEIDIKIKMLNEKLLFNSEEYLLASLLFSGYSVHDIEYLRM
jgi:hypothetical protein